MEQDTLSYGATGDWVGILGFSQGAKMAASLLLLQQKCHDQGHASERSWFPRHSFRFGVLMNGRGPLIQELLGPDQYERADTDTIKKPELLSVPTLHVHGLEDPGLEAHRAMRWDWCEQESTTVVEWQGGHRLPIRSADVNRVVDALVVLDKNTRY